MKTCFNCSHLTFATGYWECEHNDFVVVDCVCNRNKWAIEPYLGKEDMLRLMLHANSCEEYVEELETDYEDELWESAMEDLKSGVQKR